MHGIASVVSFREGSNSRQPHVLMPKWNAFARSTGMAGVVSVSRSYRDAPGASWRFGGRLRECGVMLHRDTSLAALPLCSILWAHV
jgi:hypothetical protein